MLNVLSTLPNYVMTLLVLKILILALCSNHYHAAIMKTNLKKYQYCSSLFLPALSSYDCKPFISIICLILLWQVSQAPYESTYTNRISASPYFLPPFTPPNFSSFSYVTTDEVSKLLSQSPITNCDLDTILTAFLKQYSHILLPTITNMINLFISTGIFPDQFKSCSVHPHLKNLGSDDLGNYRAISNLSFLSKLTERV